MQQRWDHPKLAAKNCGVTSGVAVSSYSMESITMEGARDGNQDINLCFNYVNFSCTCIIKGACKELNNTMPWRGDRLQEKFSPLRVSCVHCLRYCGDFIMSKR